MVTYIMPTRINSFQYALMVHSHLQHENGNTVRMNPATYRVEYIRPNGDKVPEFDWVYRKVREGKCHHDIASDSYTFDA